MVIVLPASCHCRTVLPSESELTVTGCAWLPEPTSIVRSDRFDARGSGDGGSSNCATVRSFAVCAVVETLMYPEPSAVV